MIRLAGYENRLVAVFGLGKTGLSAARALAAGGARLSAWDDDPARRRRAQEAGLDLADPAELAWEKVAALILSPGVPFTHPEPHPVVTMAAAAGVEIVCDVELLQRACPKARYVGVTGTNGKSTTAALIDHILECRGGPVQLGGNIGTPALDLDPLAEDGIYVLELSSYQLDLSRALVFDIALLLNVAQDHLDRHGDMATYMAAKRKIFRPGEADGTAVIGLDDEYTRAIHAELLAEGERRIVPISGSHRISEGVYVEAGILHEASANAVDPVMDLSHAKALPGTHNWQNAAAAFAAARALGVSSAEAGARLIDFPGLAHRLEEIAVLEDVRFVNDSKATNADAVAKALACFDAVYWIAGGRPKAGGIDSLKAHFPRVAHAFLIGEAAESFARSLEGSVPYTRSGTLARAVRQAYVLARERTSPGAVVLLSPACASFDQFADFEARGDAFRSAVLGLAAEGGSPASTPLRSARS